MRIRAHLPSPLGSGRSPTSERSSGLVQELQRETLDGKGSLQNGVTTSSLNGAIASETFSGTYTVNSDCTGTISVNIFASGIEIFTVTLNIAFDNDMKHMRGIFTSVVTPNGAQLTTVINLDGRKQ